MTRIGILGGGINGLVSAFLLRQYNPTVISPSIGGNWASGGLHVLKRHKKLLEMLNDLEVKPITYTTRGGAYWDGQLMPLSAVPIEAQKEHYVKTRGSLVGFDATCLNNKIEVEQVVEFDYSRFVARMLNRLGNDWNYVQAGVRDIATDATESTIHVTTGLGDRLIFDYVISTISLTDLVRVDCRWWDSPGLLHSRLDYQTRRLYLLAIRIADIVTAECPYNYVYLPGKDMIFNRISKSKLGSIIWVGEMSEPKDVGDLSYITWQKGVEQVRDFFPSAIPAGLLGDIPGHLLPPPAAPKYPDRILPVGRFASWQPRETVDVAATKVLEWATKIK